MDVGRAEMRDILTVIDRFVWPEIEQRLMKLEMSEDSRLECILINYFDGLLSGY